MTASFVFATCSVLNNVSFENFAVISDVLVLQTVRVRGIKFLEARRNFFRGLKFFKDNTTFQRQRKFFNRGRTNQIGVDGVQLMVMPTASFTPPPEIPAEISPVQLNLPMLPSGTSLPWDPESPNHTA